jgi:CO dehydrogenase maturation factor
MLTARRLARLDAMPGAPRVAAVVNKVRDDADAQRVAELTGLEVVGAVPLDPAVAEAARTGRPLLDVDPDAPAVAAVRSIADVLDDEEAP